MSHLYIFRRNNPQIGNVNEWNRSNRALPNQLRSVLSFIKTEGSQQSLGRPLFSIRD